MHILNIDLKEERKLCWLKGEESSRRSQCEGFAWSGVAKECQEGHCGWSRRLSKEERMRRELENTKITEWEICDWKFHELKFGIQWIALYTQLNREFVNWKIDVWPVSSKYMVIFSVTRIASAKLGFSTMPDFQHQDCPAQQCLPRGGMLCKGRESREVTQESASSWLYD